MIRGAKGCRILAELPKNKVLPETDGPFAMNSSTPYMPWEAITIAGTVSHIWSETEEDVRRQFERNLSQILAIANK
jgi:TatD DNase family protein